jgi:hypothetical protein
VPVDSRVISEFISLDGAGVTTSIIQANATPSTWSWVATSSSIVHIERIIVSIEDTGNFNADDYGALGAALTNGLTLGVYESGGLKYLLTDTPIVKNFDWGAYCYDADVKGWGVGNNFLVARWTFAKSGQPVYLHAADGEYLALSVADTLSGLIDHKVLVQGHYIKQPQT